jgi:MFS family permease
VSAGLGEDRAEGSIPEARMSPERLSRRTVLFVNIAHALDHFVLLIYPTAVIAIAAQTGLGYAELIGLATGAFLAFGLCSLPMGWLADRFGRRRMLAVFFLGYGISCLGLATASGSVGFAGWLLMLGVASAIYHPVGSTMLVTHARRLGRDLGVNGVWGNLGAASAAGVTALIAAALGWRAAFIVPGLVCLAAGVAFLALVPSDGDGQSQKTRSAALIPVTRPVAVLCVFAVAVVAGGMTFNVTTIALPKVIDERLGLDLPLVLTGWLATLVFVFGALTQLLMGNLVDRLTLPTIFVGLALLQPVGLALAALTTGVPLLIGLALAMAAIYGQVVVNDAMVARYVPARHRAKAFSVRYFLGFTVGGLAVPMIALLHEQGGVALVLGAATCFGLVICMASLAFYALTLTQPAEMATAGAGGSGNHDGVEGP